ncbi:nicotinamide riboside transporter PnuC [Modestobacter sp. I12A-02628]|uniref:Nicotinamide mononucleotide transporter n=2 Tax=Goekera deserti TaxID=2497753 RepID=A0A7K3W9M3_9ACTN|nr:nicotinamide riboside transporter PnuC [Goekera deserti]NDI49649.1 nicotinamide riboside transporter PnuC [Goekera deserti]NEL53158.1 nicotinamide mononucleotide transporter [Goekera deserti]
MGWLLDASVHVLGADILWREVIGNTVGLASAVLGMRRVTAAWPVGILANVLLFTVFLGGVFDTPQDTDLYGQAGRQVFFAAVGAYGWWRWHRNRDGGPAVVPRWASGQERLSLLAATVAGVAVAYAVLDRLGSYGPLADAWIFVGSLLATYGMARGYVEFWLVWIAVDAVGVPLLLDAGYYPSALLYAVYGGFCAWGFLTWRRLQRPSAPGATDPSLEAVG